MGDHCGGIAADSAISSGIAGKAEKKLDGSLDDHIDPAAEIAGGDAENAP